MKKVVILTFFALLALHATESYAWGRKGHEIIAEIAFSRLSPTVKNTVLTYLDGLTIQQASTWMDDIRNNTAYRDLEKAHYINIPSTSNPETDIQRELKKTFLELKDKKSLNDSLIRLDLLKIFHLVGDLHQPLHTGYESDRGGNSVAVDFFGRKSNLHRVWDSQIIEKAEIDSTAIALYIMELPQSEISSFSNVNVSAWIQESHSYLDRVYTIQNGAIDDKYILNSVPVVTSQLAKAALRLQRVLEMYFS
jgi:hypothetical protein